jgi:hypothetical protein
LSFSTPYLTADVLLVGSSFPCGSCSTRTVISRVLCALRRSTNSAK